MHVEVRDRLRHRVVDGDETAVGRQPRHHGLTHALGEPEQHAELVGGKLGQGADVIDGAHEHVPGKDRPVVEERDRARGARDHLGGEFAPHDPADDVVHRAPSPRSAA